MTKESVISFVNVSKKFKRGRKLLLKEALLDIFIPSKTENFCALDSLTFTIEKGETVGIIGDNGSGKSTILKLIAGVMFPDKGGSISVSGKIAPLIELGAGFHPELTGRENVFLNATILGMNKKNINRVYKDIIDFADIPDFIDTPVKHYSSGMYMRLGFAIAVNMSPNILLIDEILAVGDEKFREKCLLKMRQFQKNNITIILVSHSTDQIRRFCTKVLYLKKGKIVFYGSPQKAIDIYKNEQQN